MNLLFNHLAKFMFEKIEVASVSPILLQPFKQALPESCVNLCVFILYADDDEAVFSENFVTICIQKLTLKMIPSINFNADLLLAEE